jgi:diacylglycerol kinase (ATP)
MTAKVILNPYAGRWTALRRKDEAIAALGEAGVSYELVMTEYPDHGAELAAQAVAEGFSPIISAGGDGSISEVVNGMLKGADGGALPPLGILPLGSANDLVNNLKLPEDLEASARVIANGKIRRMDLCQVNGRYFDNNSAIGLEPYITIIQQKISWVKGSTRYILATLRGVADNPHWVMSLEWEGGSYHGLTTLVTIGNCARTGGVFYVTPHADPFDGLLTFVYGYIPSRGQILRVLPMTMKPDAGNYIEHPSIHEIHSPWLRVHAETPTPMHAGGEIQSHSVQDLDYCVLPKILPVLLSDQP